MSTYTEFTVSPMGCIVCYNVQGAHSRIFPCGCQLLIHDACIGFWKSRGGTCPYCGILWSPHKAMTHPLVDPPLLSPTCRLRLCTALVTVLVLLLLAMILYYFIALR